MAWHLDSFCRCCLLHFQINCKAALRGARSTKNFPIIRDICYWRKLFIKANSAAQLNDLTFSPGEPFAIRVNWNHNQSVLVNLDGLVKTWNVANCWHARLTASWKVRQSTSSRLLIKIRSSEVLVSRHLLMNWIMLTRQHARAIVIKCTKPGKICSTSHAEKIFRRGIRSFPIFSIAAA